ncbi:MAG: hypothetical protein ACUVV3_10820 [Dehalococcoidia bacterium]
MGFELGKPYRDMEPAAPYICRLVGEPSKGHGSYKYTPLSVCLSSPPHTIVAYDWKPHPDGGRNVLTADGEVRFMEESDFQRICSEQGFVP